VDGDVPAFPGRGEGLIGKLLNHGGRGRRKDERGVESGKWRKVRGRKQERGKMIESPLRLVLRDRKWKVEGGVEG
jgi:hypothetical protein